MCDNPAVSSGLFITLGVALIFCWTECLLKSGSSERGKNKTKFCAGSEAIPTTEFFRL